MKANTTTSAKRKFLVMAPLLVLPFILFAAWALGVGKGEAQQVVTEKKGLNVELPDAHNAGGPMDKLSYYQQAAADSLKLKEQSRNDPYLQKAADQQDTNTGTAAFAPVGSQTAPASFGYKDPSELKVQQKLAQLNNMLREPQASANNYNVPQGLSAQNNGPATMDVDRMEKMLQSLQSSGGSSDPETAQLNGMLERILDIQHPERVNERIKASEQQRSGQVYAVRAAEKKERISLLENQPVGKITESNGFYGLNDSTSESDEQNAIEAVVHEDQTLVNGATVKLRLLDDIMVRGTLIPKDNFVYGTVSLDGERLSVSIKSVRYKKSLYPVQLSVFDIDGLDGIYIPGAIARDVAKSSADRSIQTLGISSFDQSIGAQAAGAGIEAAKSFLSKKIKLIKVMVKAGYKVLLRDDKQKQEQ